MAGTNTGKRYKEGDKVTITAEAGYGYEIHAFKAGNNVLVMKKNEVKDEAGNVVATEYNAEYTVGKETSTVTVEYERKPMSKVRVVTADKSLGNVDFVADDIHDNFYLKGDGFVESYFVAGEPGIMASTDAKDNYVIDRWTKDSKMATRCLLLPFFHPPLRLRMTASLTTPTSLSALREASVSV